MHMRACPKAPIEARGGSLITLQPGWGLRLLTQLVIHQLALLARIMTQHLSWLTQLMCSHPHLRIISH